MAQQSRVFGITTIRVHEKDLMSMDKMHRLAEAPLDEALRAMQDCGYGGGAEVTAQNAEEIISKELEDACALVREASFQPEQTDLLLMAKDVHNLKLLIKLRLTGSDDASALMEGGCFAADALKKMVQNSDYRDLPGEFRDALEGLEQSFQGNADPARIAIELDRAYVTLGINEGKGLLREYFLAMADFTNILTLLRVRKMGAGAEKLRSSLMPEGYVPASRIMQGLEAPADAIAKLTATGPARESIIKGLEAYQKTGGMAALERERDSYIMSIARPARYDDDSIAPLIGYLLAREQEAKALRLIITAKRNGLEDSVIEERLGELYG